MKILFALDKYQTTAGGADRLAKAVVAALSNSGHEVTVVEAGDRHSRTENIITLPLPVPRLFRDGDLRMLRDNLRWHSLLGEVVDRTQPDLLLTQNMLSPASIDVAFEREIPSAIFFHGYRCLSPTFFLDQDPLQLPPLSFATAPWRSRLKWPLVKSSMARYFEAFTKAGVVIANSNYTASVIKRFYQREAAVLYPIIDLVGDESASTPDPSNPVLFVKPQSVKGVEIFLRTAKLLPEQQFLVVGEASRKIRTRLSLLRNVIYRGWVDDMTEIYEGSSLLFAPSRIPEPFGRVFVEAALHKLPAVASRTGAIPEVIGPGGVLVEPAAPADIWSGAVSEALSAGTHKHLSDAAFKNAGEMLAGHNVKTLLNILNPNHKPDNLQ